METRKLPENFSLDEFVYICISNALELAKENPSMRQFYDRLQEKVSSTLHISKEDFSYLYHPIHWTLFLDSKSSALDYIQGTRNGEENSVRLKREFTEKDVNDLSNLVLGEYKDYLQQRVNTLYPIG